MENEGSKWADFVPGPDFPPPPRPEGERVNYHSPHTIWEALEDSEMGAAADVKLLSANWMVAWAKTGRPLPKRQDCPKEAFISILDLKHMYKTAKMNHITGPKPEHSEEKRLPIIAVSYTWKRGSVDPDPECNTLRMLVDAYMRRKAEYASRGYPDMGFFVDWCSLYQVPRNNEQNLSFRRSLQHIALWYAHALTTVYMVTDGNGYCGNGTDSPGYHDRGWTSFEFQLSWLIKLADKFNVWPQVVDLAPRPRPRPPPAPLGAFKEGGHCYGKTVSVPADKLIIGHAFDATILDVYHSQHVLDYCGLGWGNVEMRAISAILPLCRNLRTLNLSHNRMSVLPESLAELKQLRELDLSDCLALIKLPDDKIKTLRKAGLAALFLPPQASMM